MKNARKNRDTTRAEPERFCQFCGNASPLEDDVTVLCGKKGIVRADYCCSRFTYDPLKREPARLNKEVKLDYVEI